MKEPIVQAATTEVLYAKHGQTKRRVTESYDLNQFS